MIDPKTHFFARPAEGRTVPHPSTGRPIRAEGQWLPRRPYFLKRLKEEALVECDPPKPEEPAANPKTDPKPKDPKPKGKESKEA